ncbi:DUF3578 domain-containing protein [Actinosynnema sp. NPDC047251]|uniref:Uncharacterized protein n=1 Tax=Saccharothrix espanaensis (strain ATCC 51144 / DSM 44229 / JCM 9112 / NBRC 15066 / NRRL 15764) TaxID=1179773 RepID=K0K8U4_SACES|nr:DUF3578 domain-containing protein [Saccharothrix espanaensis]CCH34796.1 hypothetical protein BN6_75710 [Saccharothrix espanaensis DSM 44229]
MDSRARTAANTTLPIPIETLSVQARDHIGRKSEIPWVRVYSQDHSPSATQGWYVVYLFDAYGTNVHLTLMQGSTHVVNGEYKPRPRRELKVRVDWARNALADQLEVRLDRVDSLALPSRKRKLGAAYEAATVTAFTYPAGAIPDESVLEHDLAHMLAMLSTLYLRLDVPGEPSPEVADAIVAGERSAGRRTGRGQGMRLSAPEKTAIEKRAVKVVIEHLRAEGYQVKDVGARESYDLDATRADEHLFVEVKGTTSRWGPDSEVILTRNEVDLHLREYPNTMLAVVHSIALKRGDEPAASGGTLHVVHPWRVVEENLTPLTYRYLVDER